MTARSYLPAPPVHEATDRCGACQGRGVTGEQYRMGLAPTDDRVLVVDVLCPVCDGCGRDDRHASCIPIQHAAWNPYDDEWAGTVDPEQLARACGSCHGRQWNAVFGWTQGADPPAEQLTYELRVPCGCAQALMVELPAAGVTG